MTLSSKITQDNPQIDGRRTVREVHVDDTGLEYPFDYLAEKDMDVEAILKQRAEELNKAAQAQADNAEEVAQAKAEEIQTQIDDLSAQLDVAVEKVRAIQMSKAVEVGKIQLDSAPLKEAE